MNTAPASLTASDSLVRLTHIVYALHALGLALGAFGAASVLGSFLFGWPSIIAVIINYVKRGDVRGTWLESHFTWQIRTFWFALAWAVLVAPGVDSADRHPGGHRHLGGGHVPAGRLGHLPNCTGLDAFECASSDAGRLECGQRRGFQSSWRGRFRLSEALAPTRLVQP